MTTETNIKSFTNNTTLGLTRLIFGVALVGLTASFTHGFYSDIQSATIADIIRSSRHDLETHIEGHHSDCNNGFVADPRHIRGIRRAEEM